MNKIYVAVLFGIIIIVFSAFVSADLMNIQGEVTLTNGSSTSGDIQFVIYNNETGGTIVFDSGNDFNGSIVDGEYDVVLGSNTSLSLVYGDTYYMEIYVNGEDLDFDGNERQMFISNIGSFSDTIVNGNFVVKNGSVLFNETTGSTPAAGAGTRMMWIPEKAAFRAGMVNGTQWDDSNIGNFSFAAGYSVSANGSVGAIALGEGAIASGDYGAISIGRDTIASGMWGAVALGHETVSNGSYGAIAIGRGTVSSGGYGSLASGYRTIASGGSATAFGQNSEATGDYGLAGGYYSIASGDLGAVALGYLTNASGNYSFAGGYNTTANGSSGVAFGLSSAAKGDGGSVALGYYATASGWDGATALGRETTASGSNGATALGYYATASGWDGAVALGEGSIASGNSGVLAAGYQTTASGNYGATALGFNTTASGDYGAIAMGRNIEASGESTFAVGLDGTFYSISQNNVMAIMGGNVGIGTPTPGELLDVNGSINVSSVSDVCITGGNCLSAIIGANQEIDQNVNTTGSPFFLSINVSDWSNVSITESQISDLGSYLSSESDPLWTANQSNYIVKDTVSAWIIEYQNISNIPICSGSDKLTYNGSTLSCSSDQTGIADGTGSWINTSTNTSTTLDVFISSGDLIMGGGNAGFGTFNPGERVDVLGNINASGDVCITGGNCLSDISGATTFDQDVNTTSNVVFNQINISTIAVMTPTDSPGTCDSNNKGAFYMDDTSNKPCFCNSTAWVEFENSSATC